MIPGLLGALSGGFRPLDIAACVLWLDETGSDPSVWTDVSGSGNSFTNVTEAQQPIIVLNQLNGYQSRSFDGTADKLTSGLAIGNTFSLIFALRNSASGTFRRFSTWGEVDNGMSFWQSQTGAFGLVHSGTIDLIGDPRSDTNWNIWSIVIDGSNALISVNGAEYVASAAFAATYINTTSFLGVGTTEYAQCEYASVLGYTRGLSGVERMQVEKYLSQRYAITIDQSPVNTVLPALSGTAQVGQSLSCDNGTWTNTPTTYTYQWYLEVSEATYNQIVGATTSSLLLTGAMEGLKVQCRVAASNAFAGPTEAQSADSDAIIAA